MFRQDLRRYEQQHAPGGVAKAAGYENAAAAGSHETMVGGKAAVAGARGATGGEAAVHPAGPRPVRPLTPG